MIDQPTLNGGIPNIQIDGFTDEQVRLMGHADWLGQFATVLDMDRPGSPPRSVFRQGAIAKLRLAARYIRLLETDLKTAKETLDDALSPEGR